MVQVLIIFEVLTMNIMKKYRRMIFYSVAMALNVFYSWKTPFLLLLWSLFFQFYFDLHLLFSQLSTGITMQKFICGGRLIFGPDARSLVVTFLLIVVPIIIFCAHVAKNLLGEFSSYNAGYAVMLVAIIFTIYVSSHCSSCCLCFPSLAL